MSLSKIDLSKKDCLDLELPKFDYVLILIRIGKDKNGKKLDDNDQLYFSVKKYASDTDYLIRKSIGHGIRYNEETNRYEIELTSEDTQNMAMDTSYIYDIKIHYEGTKPKQKIIGNLKLTKSVDGVVIHRGGANG